MLYYVFRLFAKISEQFITLNLISSQKSMLTYSTFYMFKMLSSSAVLHLSHIVRNNYTEFRESLPRSLKWNVSKLTSLMIATLAFKTWFQMVPYIKPLEYLNGDDYKILWEKEGLGMSRTYM